MHTGISNLQSNKGSCCIISHTQTCAHMTSSCPRLLLIPPFAPRLRLPSLWKSPASWIFAYSFSWCAWLKRSWFYQQVAKEDFIKPTKEKMLFLLIQFAWTYKDETIVWVGWTRQVLWASIHLFILPFFTYCMSGLNISLNIVSQSSHYPTPFPSPSESHKDGQFPFPFLSDVSWIASTGFIPGAS